MPCAPANLVSAISITTSVVNIGLSKPVNQIRGKVILGVPAGVKSFVAATRLCSSVERVTADGFEGVVHAAAFDHFHRNQFRRIKVAEEYGAALVVAVTMRSLFTT